ncbi:MAG TPA: single-stranded DNA-binding protein [Cyanobacteria bacterium UBA8530]|nr:single-stranded DNA-binding protein [Cyanobacteria bacterium UBA8530]
MLNSVVLVGRVGQDPEMKYFETGKVKTTFSLAVNRPVKRTEGNDSTDWFRIELWGKQAEVAGEYVRKGSLVGILGRLEFSRWTDANGVKHEMPVISANQLRLLGSKRDEEASMESEASF